MSFTSLDAFVRSRVSYEGKPTNTVEDLADAYGYYNACPFCGAWDAYHYVGTFHFTKQCPNALAFFTTELEILRHKSSNGSVASEK